MQPSRVGKVAKHIASRKVRKWHRLKQTALLAHRKTVATAVKHHDAVEFIASNFGVYAKRRRSTGELDLNTGHRTKRHTALRQQST